MEGVRNKFHTDGETNTITLCVRNVRSSDEGKYKIILTNCHGTFSDETQLYVSKPGCTDFRTLLRKSKYAKWGQAKGDPKWGDLKGVQKVIFFPNFWRFPHFNLDIKSYKQFFPFSQAQDQFLTPLQDQTAKEGKDKKVDFIAKFSKQNATPKWFCRKNVCTDARKH